MGQHKRWIAVCTYHTDNGNVDVEHYLEELYELQDIVEQGPDWHSLVDIIITLHPARRAYITTVEQAAKL